MSITSSPHPTDESTAESPNELNDHDSDRPACHDCDRADRAIPRDIGVGGRTNFVRLCPACADYHRAADGQTRASRPPLTLRGRWRRR